jgi:hypothetical protein
VKLYLEVVSKLTVKSMGLLLKVCSCLRGVMLTYRQEYAGKLVSLKRLADVPLRETMIKAENMPKHVAKFI